MMTRPLVLLPSLPRRRRLLLLLLVVVVVVASCAFPALAHPGAVADGRASCGEEYSTAENAYTIPDIREAWYLRRLATCSNPVFWTKFEVVESYQPIYIAVISPELERFEDELQFNGILYGPGLSPNGSNNNGMSPIPSTETIPPEVTVDEELAKLGAGYISSPARFDTCDFVDTNPVMKSFSDLHNDRCMEEFDFPADFSDALQQSTKAWSWWLYSFNHVAAEPGTYYLQTWLTTREDVVNNNTTTSTQVLAAQGKYEMTLGPWTWVGTPSEAVLEQAQEQGTSCSCSVNALDYKEQYFDRLGDLDGEALALAQLQGASCQDPSLPEELTSPCHTIPQRPYMSDNSATEWSGSFVLEANRTYEWSFHSYFQGMEEALYDYPDPGMYVHIVSPLTTSVEQQEVDAKADQTLTASVESENDFPKFIVAEGETFNITDASQPQFVRFTETSLANSTTILLQPTMTGTYFFYTQHVPSEFMAHFLRDQETGRHIFPYPQFLYVDVETELSDPSAAINLHPTILQVANILLLAYIIYIS
mmetsp:Transcript_40049/g.96706  ORF Transcript_40049/g.96706 Transcript_40049/m.96706 type:complete len:535 (+) Transcript_40049:107-1711(+)